MAESPLKSPLQKPPGYRDPNANVQTFPRQTAAGKPILPPPFRPIKKRRRSFCRSCCCCFSFLFLFLIVVVSLAAVIFYLLFDPKLPVFHLQSFRISNFSVSHKPDGSYLDAHSVIRVEFENPNSKLSIIYGAIDYDVTIGDDTDLGGKSIPGFNQKCKNSTSLKAEAGVVNKLLDVGDGKKLMDQFKSKELMVDVEAHTGIGIVVGGWRIGPVAVSLECNSKLKNIDAGEMPKCKVNLLRWINIH